jgi:2-keto-myo-inositol isomerase
VVRAALNGATLGPCSLEEELATAAAAGFDLVELRAPKLDETDSLRAVLAAHGLNAWSINSLEAVGEAQGLEAEARRLAAIAGAAGCPYVLCVPGTVRAGLEEAVAALAEVCSSEGATLAFEFMGFEWSAVRTLTEAVAVADAAGGLPVVVDSFHWAAGGGTLDELAALDPARVAVIHLNDVPDRPLDGLGDADRVLPGDGVLPLRDFVAALRSSGFDGVLSVELFNPEIWRRGLRPAADSARRSLARLGA